MGYRAHVQTKHVIEYGNCHFNWASERIYSWLLECGVVICRMDDTFGDGSEWEMEKSSLRKIPKDAYNPIDMGDYEITSDELREFVKDLLEAPTGEYAYVSWF